MALHVVGIRHHSPACARVVSHVLARVRPAHVLIEGPADMNDRIGELLLPHALPVAVFTYLRAGLLEEGNVTQPPRRHASWTPFCSYSPEWIALQQGHALGAEVRFCDLPAWDEVFDGRKNRYADRDAPEVDNDPNARVVNAPRAESYVTALCREYGLDDMDTLWDHLFEGPHEDEAALDALKERLETYFLHLRGDAPGGPRDAPREELMARFCAWAMHEGAARPAGQRDVVLVCGGFHAPYVKKRALALAAEGDVERPTLTLPEASTQYGSYLVPYSYRRLDAFAGYDAGMPSPAFYELVHERGPAAAAEYLLVRVTERLRKKKQTVSTADLIAARTLGEALARMRGHPALLRTDLLDGLAGALVKDGLEAPLPWAHRGPLLPRTDPLLVEVVAALSGEREGALASATPQPPLVADVQQELARHDLVPSSELRVVKLSLKTELGRARSRVLHRLAVLTIPGFVRASGPMRPTDVALDEVWHLQRKDEAIAVIIEASIHGATLEAAAIGRLEEALLETGGRLALLAKVLATAVFVGIEGLAGDILDRVGRAVQSEPSFSELGQALGTLIDVYLHGELLGASGAEAIEHVLVAAFDRGLWLLEGRTGPSAPLDEGDVQAVAGLRDLILRGPRSVIGQRARAEGVFSRRAVDRDAPPAVRGASLGALWSLALGDESEAREQLAIEALAAASLPSVLGDFLGGLFGVARSEALHSEGLFSAIDDVLCALADQELLIALPALRLAFSFFPPREREILARRVLARRGGALGARDLLTLGVGPDDLAQGLALDARTFALAQRYALSDEQDPEAASDKAGAIDG